MDESEALPDPLSLLHYRQRVAGFYASARAAGAGASSWTAWRGERDRLIGSHTQSPLPADRRGTDWRTPFAPYDPSWRLGAELVPDDDATSVEIPHSATGVTRFTSVGTVSLRRGDFDARLTVFVLDAYGGGLFVPFRDATNGRETYGGGRYLLDTVKGADLGLDGPRLVLDFNYAYHPSCAWDSRWSCPLAPPSNWLTEPVRAGELLPLGDPAGD